MTAYLLYALLGCFSGFVAGLFGIGGGMVIVPVLVYSFQLHGLDSHILTHLAIGTSLATIMLTSLSAIHAHHQRGAVQWPVVKNLAPGLVVGAFLGAQCAQYIPGAQLRRVFGVFLVIIGIKMTFMK